MNIPRVTEILNPYADFSHVSADVLELASQRGGDVHAVCAAYALGLYAPIPDGVKGFCASFRSWFDRYVHEVIVVEAEIIHPAWGYIGHADLIAKVTGFEPGCPVVAVIDIKTSALFTNTMRGQIAAYVEAARKDYEVTVGGILRLREDGGLPTLVWIDDLTNAFSAFVGALSAYNYFNKGKGRGKDELC